MNLTYGFYSRSAITKIRNKIENSKYCFWAWNELQNLVVNLMLSCNFALANELLTAIFEVVSPEDFFPEDRRMLECFWHYIKHKGNVRPANVPWGRWSNEDIEQLWHRGELDPTKIEFHERGWQILSYKARRAVKSINRAIDGGNKNAAHQWKTTNDPWAILVCAMYLCKPVDGKPPFKDSLIEASQAFCKFYQVTKSNSDQSEIFPMDLVLILTSHLGQFEIMTDILVANARYAVSYDISFKSQDMLDKPQFWVLFEKNLHMPISIYQPRRLRETNGWSPLITRFGQIIAEPKGRECVAELKYALRTYRENKRWSEITLPNVMWYELLREFCTLAFELERGPGGKFSELEKPPKHAKEILLPPLTAKEIADIEKKLGPLPSDIKDMSLWASGFIGTSTLFGGGFPGIDTLRIQDARKYETQLEISGTIDPRNGQPLRPNGTETVIKAGNEGEGFGDVYVTSSTTPTKEGFEHVLCPAETWNNIKSFGVATDKKGEYRYMQYSSVAGERHRWTVSMREYIAREIVRMRAEMKERKKLEQEEKEKREAEEMERLTKRFNAAVLGRSMGDRIREWTDKARLRR